jgi:hypothetical protein
MQKCLDVDDYKERNAATAAADVIVKWTVWLEDYR